ncbi:MAG: hypothetical protein ACRDOO_16420 [Actinomadura sp.]
MPEERREVLGGEPRRAPRAWVTWLGVATLAVAAVVAVSRGGDSAPPVPPPRSPTPSAPPVLTGPPWGFVPPVRTDGHGRTSVHLIFPDGSTAEMSYSTGLDLARLGVSPHTSGWLGAPGGECCHRAVIAPPVGDAWFATGGPPAGHLDGADGGQVAVVPPPVAGPLSPYLVFTFGRWRVGVQSDRTDRMDLEQRQGWAGNLTARVVAGGFLVLRGRGPLRLGTPPDERAPESWPPHGGPQLRFGRGFMAEYGIGSYDDPVLLFEPVTHCRNSMVIAGLLTAFRDSVCKGSSMRVWVGGDDGFIRRALPDIRVWNVRPPPG